MTQDAEAASGPRVSVVIPTYERVERLRRVLRALAEQTYPDDRLEVVVVSDGSTDGTDDYLASGTTPLPVVACRQPNQGPAAARNRGVDAAGGDLVLFLDDDVVPAPDLVEEHVRAHDRAGAGAVVLGPMLTPPDADLRPWVRYEQDMLYKQYDAMAAGEWAPTARQFYTGNASLAREMIERVGGFDTQFTRAEDVELAYRLRDRGARFVFAPQARGFHYADRSLASWSDIAYRYGRNDVIFGRDRGQTWLLETIAKEFPARHALIRALVRACLRVPALGAAVDRTFRRLIAVLAVTGPWAVTRGALSAVYNVRYYRGVIDEIGVRTGEDPSVERLRTTLLPLGSVSG